MTSPSDHRLRVYRIRDEAVVLDSDLAGLYGVATKVFNQAIRRHAHRFPRDFAFQLTTMEFAALRSQIVTLSSRGGRRHLPWAFTEHGAIMAATILNSDRAVAMSTQPMNSPVCHSERQRRIQLDVLCRTRNWILRYTQDDKQGKVHPPYHPTVRRWFAVTE